MSMFCTGKHNPQAIDITSDKNCHQGKCILQDKFRLTHPYIQLQRGS